MRTVFFSVLALLHFLGTPAVACSFGPGYDIFVPKIESWDLEEDWEKIPAPIIKNVKISRGTESAGFSCDDAGTIEFRVRVPANSPYPIKDLGVYFRLKHGALPTEIFPSVPTIGEVKGRKSRFFFVWLDGHPSQQKPIDIVLEVFFVSNGLVIGPSTFVTIKSD